VRDSRNLLRLDQTTLVIDTEEQDLNAMRWFW
jgi:hypothetical protein